ncbi:MAG TPA: thiol peroxidase [Kofleriaceae bacterium]
MKHLLLVAALAACSHATSESEVVSYLKAHPDVVTKAQGRTTDATKIRRGDTPLTLVGPTLDVGAVAPDVTVVDENLAPVQLSSFKGKTVVLSVVPSIDTRVCENQTLHLSQAMDQLPTGVAVLTVSRDLPFAQSRFAQDPSIKTKMVSDFKGGAFGKAFGVEVQESGLLARSVWVIGPDGKIAYRQLVADQGTEPELDPVIAAVKKTAGT